MDYLERVASDPVMRLELEAARAWGVPPTELWGAPRVTTYQQRPDGSLARSETVRWTAEDRQWVRALAVYEARLCPRGHDTAKSLLKENLDAYRGVTIGECQMCAAADIEASRWDEYKRAPSLVFGVEGPDPKVQEANRATFAAQEAGDAVVIPSSPDPEDTPVPGEGDPARVSPPPSQPEPPEH